METKTFEVRDEGTHIPVLAIKLKDLSAAERYQFARAGYGQTASELEKCVLLIKLSSLGITWSTVTWGGKRSTLRVAHEYIIQNWNDLRSGQVIDVQFILGETSTPKRSEAFERN